MIGPDLNTRFKAVAGITALVGQRIYPVILPQNPTLPAVTHSVVSGVPERTMGQSPGGTRTVDGTGDVNSWARTLKEARDVAQAIFVGLDAYSNAAALSGQILRIEISWLDDGYEPDTLLYRVTQLMRIWWRE